MSFFDVVFYLFATITVLAGVGVVVARNPVHAALFLVLAFCSAAGIWMLLEAEFLAITLILVYVGAVMVLFLFVVMMLDINLVKLREGFWRWFPFGALLAGLMVFEMVWVLGSRQTADVSKAIVHAADYSNTKELGRLIYTQYVYPFEIAAVILLVAMVAAIALTLRRRAGVKSQNVADQVKVKKADRLRIVSMKSEPKQ
ncbi:MAG TPA: NADH-quinone oxidoreductase subunit J [Gallionella sp.]|jgi:NADH-quinone oxidoreductase subunit J|nr:NADH-quinone oxidoreductase subunit J [Gallionella sp.]OGS67192.1 MAG: NADH:ubiquinone oxidoreductase subunit J [Gallionellales bacterium GWA2_54_124]OGT42328.1 MAG: NADH:ubiquinone oxidoreductase subunit J [Gallionellales bacterium RIFOXYD2_FULL_52_7]HCI51978.1 NADH-quinone oxidoreductase subunit J [Gallionella sp.]